MTTKEKQHKIKLILLIILVLTEKARRHTKTIHDVINITYEGVFWAKELKRVSRIPTFESGGIAIVGSSNNKEVIIEKI